MGLTSGVRRDLGRVSAGRAALDGREIGVKTAASKDTIDRRYGGQALRIASPLPRELLADLPGEHRRLLLLHS